MYIDKSIIKIIDGLLIDWVICSNKQNGQDCYDTSEVAHFSWVIANQKEIITLCWPAIMTVFEFPPRLSLSRNVNTESLYGTNSFFRKDGRLDIVEELMEFSAKRKINTTCTSCVTDVWRGNKKDAREQKRTREGGHLVPTRGLRKNFLFRVAREASCGRTLEPAAKPRVVSLAAVFWMSRDAPPSFGGALRDVQKTAARETKPRGVPF